ncbi:Mu-like prophage major head subunit gpT family protein [Vallitalea guaymasensis]|uniref:phage major capsid protein n=1 Tax=Vallitalea guaymasensis TaxID=1185412 RepID=UPI00187D6CF1|nr:Mu-like prophage major head subunit gpT family protein [Vallitalea guaymasensis]
MYKNLREAASSSDFPILLRNTMNKTMLREYQAVPSNWEKFCSVDDKIKDFKDKNVTRLSEADKLLKVEENGEYKDSKLGDSGMSYHVDKYGRVFSVSWETIINDDTNTIMKQPKRFGRAAKRTLNQFVINDILEGNIKTYDGKTLFHEDHDNLLTGSESKLTPANVQLGITRMRRTKDDKDNIIYVPVKYLIVPPELEFEAKKIVKSVTDIEANNSGVINPIQGTLEVIVEDHLIDPDAWYIAADPKDVETIEVGFLKHIGRNPQLFIKDVGAIYASGGKVNIYEGSFENDKIDYKVRHAWGATAVDYRGMFKGAGK